MSNSAFTPTTTQVTTEVPTNVPVVTDWVQYTPTTQGLGTLAISSVRYRRIGDSLEIQGYIKTGTTTASNAYISIPSGLTIDSTKITSAINAQKLGEARRIESGASGVAGAWVLFYDGSDNSNMYIGIGSASNTFTKNTGLAFFSSGDGFTFNATVPISQWSSGTTTLADRAVEEYASNSSTSTTASDTTSFAYGPSGSQIQNITANLTRRVRFTTPILPTDKFCLEVSINRVNWQDVSYRFGDNATSDIVQLTRQISTSYGVGYIVPINSTDIDITFGQYAEPSSATYGSAGRAWSVGAGSWYWRVRKVSGGAAVGFPVSARNIVGDTSGTTVPTGMIGETKVVNFSGTSFVPSTSLADVTGLSMSLDSGVWLVKYQACVYLQNNAAATTTFINLVLTDGSNNQIANTQSNNAFENLPTAGIAPILTVERSAVWVVSGSQTLKLRAVKSSNSGNTALLNDAASYRITAIMATRIA